jgi:hypothetical protein
VRYWTEDEVRAALPRMRVLIDALRRGERQDTVARTNGHEVGSDVKDANGVDPDPVDVPSALGELEDKGVVLRDSESGLLDFPAVTDKGVVYLLCWKRDEAELGWWHFAEEGFDGRKPLPLPSDL